jgi:hypothetical protein
MSNAATADESAVYDEIERRRRAFLAALNNDTSPVQPPRVDAGGLLIEEGTEDRRQGIEDEDLAPAAVLPMVGMANSTDRRDAGSTEEEDKRDACPTKLSRRERRARQRMLEKKLKMRKAK